MSVKARRYILNLLCFIFESLAQAVLCGRYIRANLITMVANAVVVTLHQIRLLMGTNHASTITLTFHLSGIETAADPG